MVGVHVAPSVLLPLLSHLDLETAFETWAPSTVEETALAANAIDRLAVHLRERTGVAGPFLDRDAGWWLEHIHAQRRDVSANRQDEHVLPVRS